MVDSAANQILRATVTTEQLKGPGTTRFQIDSIGNAAIILARSPILSILGGQCAPAIPPLQWTTIPANMYVVDSPPLSVYGTSVPADAGEWGQSVTLGGGYVSTWNGRGGYFLQTTYVNGWPHCSLTTASIAGATTIQVDDCTGWGPPAGSTQGAAGVIYDPGGGGQQETATVTLASATTGPGTLTITPALTWPHSQGIIFSGMASTLQWAAILFGVAQALTRGATATTPQTISPAGVSTGSGADALMKAAKLMVRDFKRIW